jgi:predicted metalloprotease
MRWKDREESQNVEDRRGRGPSTGGIALGGGIGGIVIILLLAFLSGDPARFLQQVQNDPNFAQVPQDGGRGPRNPDEPDPDSEVVSFVKVILRDTEDVWSRVMAEQLRKEYKKPRLVLFQGRVKSACGLANSAVGPFYCPGDEQVYLDVGFFDELRDRFKASGDFAQAYVVAHEVGHHVQNLLGISDKVHAQRERLSDVDYNNLSVRMELQADYFAGVWAHHAEKNWKILETGDIEEALRCANAIGDDRLQKQTQGYVVPDSFTHGTSEQRARWFTRGLKSGKMAEWNPFEVDEL